MNHASQTFFPHASTGPPPNYEMLKEEHEASVLGASPPAAPVTSTVNNICRETSVPTHVVWSLFNMIFMNYCCLGFIMFAYSVKSRDRKMVGDVIGAQNYASTAKCLHIFALVLGIILIVIFIILCTAAPVIIADMILLMKESFQHS
ncbi:interferon-induced transmembrane protein 3 [Tupaia chinensis]|uniref:Interferon-induced transmembrane protein 3 n=1 Tax=Tupaia chinensis TaxID=246437 RepID=L9L4U3_TUPCH|nr:interferon-induced transmembrane protein 3 [Tupaia chinensis]ELW70061.1 Interferon-induced transmembrane protein 3 [Tupaia chinensis]